VHTKLSSAHLMETAAGGGITFAASQSGGFLFPRFQPAYDAAAALVELVGMLSSTGQNLSKLVQAIPPVHIAHESVVTPGEQKGLVMRTLVEQLGDRPLVLVDGVKVIEDDGWVLALPDPEEPVTHVWAEGPSTVRARAMAQQYAVRLRQLLH
jgi:mannose-1-phosphate guanylyltransferase/phosphomannomutase